MPAKVIQWERIKVKEVILFIFVGMMFIIVPVIILLFKPKSRTGFNTILFVVVSFYGGIKYIVTPIRAFKPHKIVFTDNALEIHYANLVNKYKVRVVQYDEIDVVYETYRRSPCKDNLLIRFSDSKEMLAGLSSKSVCEELIDEFSRHPDVKIIHLKMK